MAMSSGHTSGYLQPVSNMDTEYNALRRRMSRCRVKDGGKLASADDMDVIEEDTEDYRDLIKFWKRHNVGFAKEMLPAVQKRSAAKKAAKSKGAQGRRKSIEFEDLEQTSSGSLSLPAHLNPAKGFRKAGSNSTIKEEEEGDQEELTPRKARNSTTKQPIDYVRSNSKIFSNKQEPAKPAPKKHVYKRAESDSILNKQNGRKISGDGSPKSSRDRNSNPTRSSSLKKK